MKVYLLTYFDGHDTWVAGVYAARDAALQAHEENPEWSEGFAGHSISEYEVEGL